MSTDKSRQVEAIYPLSPMQQGMLFHTVYAPGSVVYFQQVRCTFEGDLNVNALRRAWQRVVDVHPILRTAFSWEHHKQPVQVVRRQATLPWEYADLRGLPAHEQESRLEGYLSADRERGFALLKPPLMRCALMRTGDDSHEFVWSYHHILLDGWSVAQLLKQVSAYYAAFRRDQELQLPIPRPFQDYITWLKAQDMTQAEAFWRRALGGFQTPTPMPAARASAESDPDRQDYGVLQVELSQPTTSALHSLARRHQLTLNTLVQGAWALLLSRYSGERDVLFGSVVSGRPAVLSGIEEMIGLFVNTLPVRVRVEDAEPVLAWLKRNQEQQVEALQYEHAPLVQIQGWSEVPRGQQLFETIYGFENYPVEELSMGGGLRLRDARSVERTNYLLNLMVWQGPALSLKLFYDCRRFDAAAVGRVLGHLRALLESMAADANQRVADLSMLTPAERRQLVVEWNETSAPYSSEACLHQLFEEQAARTPEAVAVVSGEEQLSYGELDARSNRMARHLRSLGVGPESVVGVMSGRSAETVVSLLGILKAGGAYVPLDPSYPQERLRWMLEDSGARVLVTEERLLGRAEGFRGLTVCPDRDREQIGRQPAERVRSGARAENAAYLIYTSGSTGRPKGVLATHRGAVNRFQWMWRAFPFEAGEVCCQKTNLSFVDSVWEIFGPLLQGVRLVVIPDEVVQDPSRLIESLSGQQVSRIVLVPSLLKVILEGADDLQERLRRLKFWVTSGEALPVELCKRFRERLPGSRLINLYGSSEVSADASFYETGDEDEAAGVPIGVPISNTQLYILDSRARPVPVGVSGELYVGGEGLARGYLRRADLTAERFVPDPFSREPGRRMYRTGDIARYRADGRVEYQGRTDQQVKLRGFRIELGEVEAALRRHAGVREAVVTLRESGADRRLVAYVVADDAAGLREHLRGLLPDYMVPSQFVLLDSLPLTPNGKIDRRRLPEPDRTTDERNYVAPRSPTEEVLASVFSEVTGAVQVGADDNFFEAGGHSLSAMQVVSRVRELFHVELPVRRLFESPTVAGLAAAVEQASCRKQDHAPSIQRAPRDGELPCSYAQQRLWLIDQLEDEKNIYNLPAAVRMSGALNMAALAASLDEVTARHEALRTNFVDAGGNPVQVIRPHLRLTLPVIDLSQLTGSDGERELLRLAREEARRPFDLAREPLLRVKLLKTGEGEHVLLLTMHHIISDGWSMGVLVREVTTLYAAYAAGQESPLQELPVQYADFAIWQRQFLTGEVLDRQLSYWREQLRGAPPVLELPADRVRPPSHSFRGATLPFTLPDVLVASLRELSRREGVTLFMTLLAAFDCLLNFYTGREDIVVGTDIANRNRGETEDLIGFFVNQLVLRTDLSGNPSFRELLGRVNAVCQGAYAHQDLPFDRLVGELNPKRDRSRAVLFQVKIILQNAPTPPLALPDLTLTPREIQAGTAKYDLLLDMGETGQGLKGAVHYYADIFDSGTVERLLKLYEAALRAVCARADIRLSELREALAEADERRSLTEEKAFHEARRHRLKNVKRQAVA